MTLLTDISSARHSVSIGKTESRRGSELRTPSLLIDLDRLKESWSALRGCFPDTGIHYAVKANPAPEIIGLLLALGSRFDVASPAEIDLCLDLGASPAALSYGNTVKKSRDIAYAWNRGVRLFAFDSDEELDKLAANAPGSRVFCRILTECAGSSWPLAKKFGCGVESAEKLLAGAPERGLVPWGVSFHVGSQQTDPSQWFEPIRQSGRLFQRLNARGVRLRMLNLGGGFPAQYRSPIPDLSEYYSCIYAAIDEHFADCLPEVMIEPGRGLVGDCGTILTQVVLVSRRHGPRWIYLDIGKFGGLPESMDECIQYRIRAVDVAGEEEPAILAGPTCDSADTLYEKNLYQLPLGLREGDVLEILSAGAYTSSYASVGFNGFSPLATYFV